MQVSKRHQNKNIEDSARCLDWLMHSLYLFVSRSALRGQSHQWRRALDNPLGIPSRDSGLQSHPPDQRRPKGRFGELRGENLALLQNALEQSIAQQRVQLNLFQKSKKPFQFLASKVANISQPQPKAQHKKLLTTSIDRDFSLWQTLRKKLSHGHCFR